MMTKNFAFQVMIQNSNMLLNVDPSEWGVSPEVITINSVIKHEQSNLVEW